jgi:CRP-like cAMP-binding protein
MAFGRHRDPSRHRSSVDGTVDASSLAGVALFDGMSTEELGRVAGLCTRMGALPGEVLVDQGDAGDYCFVVVAGTASVYVAGEYVAMVAPGTTVGETALVEHRPRNATVVANDQMELLRFDPRHFRELLTEMPKANERIMEILGRRLER